MDKVATGADVFDALTKLGCTSEPCGSRVTCSPPPADTDQDHLVVMPDDHESISAIVSSLDAANFKWEGNEHYQDAAGDFMSWRRDDLNLIVTRSAEFATRHRAATAVCKRLNLMDKQDRIAVFQAVLYGKADTKCPTRGTPLCNCPGDDDEPLSPLVKFHRRAVAAAEAFEDAASYEETMWTGWGDQIVPPYAEMRRVKAQQAVSALRDAQKVSPCS